ncbi:Nucleoporin Nup43 [Linderina macrospora]|uniref:Nucleoporin Nup43 n=1 Tax=Linderina macrospora TaxID=4868 RepID=A0ACC1J9K6_9FUNG|nr:Nucleoporin Nup43 [Linderina macrospora]
MAQSVSRKITAARWLQPRSGKAYNDTDLYFVTGSSTSTSTARLSLWTTPNPDFTQQSIEPTRDFATPVGCVSHEGDVTSIAVALSAPVLATGSSYGQVSVYSIDSDSTQPLVLSESITAHRYANNEPAVCTGVSVQPAPGVDAEIASCGEDGHIAFAPMSRLGALQRYDIDSTVITGICWTTPQQVAVSTRAGQIKMVDRRQPNEIAAAFVGLGNNVAFECVNVHPSQPYRIATGTDNGSVMVWDVRNSKKPQIDAFGVHGANVWSIQFHPGNCDKVVSCSDDATVAVTDWTNGAGAHSVRVLSNHLNVLSINCFDFCPFTKTSLLVGGSDSGNILLNSRSSCDFSL